VPGDVVEADVAVEVVDMVEVVTAAMLDTPGLTVA
jgi:hypothetical protein